MVVPSERFELSILGPKPSVLSVILRGPGARDGIRARDLLLGRETLYQLSYSRVLKVYQKIASFAIYSIII